LIAIACAIPNVCVFAMSVGLVIISLY